MLRAFFKRFSAILTAVAITGLLGAVSCVKKPDEPDVAATADTKLRISTDQKVKILTVEKSFEAAPGDNDFSLTIDSDLEPGFYRAACYVNGKIGKDFVFGISPEKIVSAPDKQHEIPSDWAGKYKAFFRERM